MKKLKKIFATILSFVIIFNISSTVFAGPIWISVGKCWQFQLHQLAFNGDVYHVHIRNTSDKSKKSCIRLDNFKPCDKNQGIRKKNGVPQWVVEKVLSDSRVSGKAKMYNQGIKAF